jgi:NTE family protein
LVVSPYNNPFYRDSLGPLLEQVLPQPRLALLNAAASPRVFVTTVNVGTDMRKTFTQPEVTIDTLRASACLPSEFRAVQIGADYYWDGGYIGNPALEPLLDQADDLLLVLVNPLTRKDGIPPRSARAILDRLNQITFNASVVLEMNGIAAINSLLQELRDPGIEYEGSYRTINLHLIRDDAFMARLGFVSKSSTSWPLLEELHAAGHRAADRFLRDEGDAIGQRSSADVKQALIRPMLKN